MILFGKVLHERYFPVEYRFVYRVFSLMLDIDELPQLSRRLRLFSHNRFNIFSFYDRDHGPGADAPLQPWIHALLAANGVHLEGGRIKLLCFPRVLGYVFNPLSTWYCYHADGSLRAVLCEVSNTFGERHHYLLHENGRPLRWPVKGEKEKVFHVSPFIGMNARYRFRLSRRDDRVAVLIRESYGGKPMLVASLAGRLRDLSDRRLIGAALAYPFLTLKVIAAIHWHALSLWLKGARFYPKPNPPARDVT